MPRKRSSYKKKRQQYLKTKKQQNQDMDEQKQKQIKNPSDTPENDEYNFYFERQGFGVYFFYEGYVSQENYTTKECHNVIRDLNFFKTPSVIFSGLFFGSVVYMIYCYMNAEQYSNLQIYGLAFIILYFCFTWCVNQTIDMFLAKYLQGLNKKLHEKNVHWRIHPWGLYLHLCVNYVNKEEKDEEDDEEEDEDSIDKED